MNAPEATILLTYGLLWAAVLSVWSPYPTPLWPWLAGASLLSALASGVAAPLALIPIAGLIGAGYLLERSKSQALRGLALAGVVLLSLALALHLAPGFTPVEIARDLCLAQDSVPFTLRWHYDKGVAGLLVLALCVKRPGDSSNGWRVAAVVVALTLALAVSLMPLAAWLDQVRLDPKFPAIILWWALGNLFITSVAEEAFFRGLIQARLAHALAPRVRHSAALAVVVAALLFGIAHAGAGPISMGLALLAGLAYGLAYQLTGRIEASILVHFFFNLAHLTLFSYPRLSLQAACSAGPC